MTIRTSAITLGNQSRYQPFLEILRSIRQGGLTVLSSNAQQEGLEAGLPTEFVTQTVQDAVNDGSKPGVLNYWGNMSLSR